MTEEIYTKENGEYLKNNPNWHVEGSPWKAKQILKMLDRNPINPKTVAEVGCGAGEILNQLYKVMPDDVRFSGYDISIDAISIAKQREKDRLEFEHEDLVKIDKKFDLLLMIDVFEHVDDYLGFLKLCKNKATHIMFHIPLDISVNRIFRNDLISLRKSVGHLHHFTKETALATLEDTGYEIIDFFYTTSFMDFPRKSISSKLTYLPKKMIYSANKDLAVKLLGGCSLLVLAK